eukprot:7765727-Heterocapsa_arctica.AAC.1
MRIHGNLSCRNLADTDRDPHPSPRAEHGCGVGMRNGQYACRASTHACPSSTTLNHKHNTGQPAHRVAIDYYYLSLFSPGA